MLLIINNNNFSVNNGVREGVWFEVLMFATMNLRTVPCRYINRSRGTIDVHSGTTWHSPSCLHILHSYVLTVCLNRPKKTVTMSKFNASSSDARLSMWGVASGKLSSGRVELIFEASSAPPPHPRALYSCRTAVPPFQVTRGLQHPQQFSHFVVLFSNLVG